MAGLPSPGALSPLLVPGLGPPLLVALWQLVAVRRQQQQLQQLGQQQLVGPVETL